MSNCPIEVWRGTANAWQCDHLGHMNTRFYLAIVEEGMAALGFAEATVRAQHMRFHREARAGAALHATGQVLADGDLLFVLRHSETDQVAATFRLCTDTWQSQAEVPKEAQPRSVTLENQTLTASLARADELGLRRTGLGVIVPEVCDLRGIWRLSGFMGRIADSVSQLPSGDWRTVLERTAAAEPIRVGGALVEFQTLHARWPRLGDRCELRSGLAGCTDRVFYAAHWLLDPATGEPWAAVRAVGVPLDLDARRIVALTPEAQEAYRAASVPGLGL